MVKPLPEPTASAYRPASNRKAARAVSGWGRNFHACHADFSARAALYAFTGQVKKDHPVIDILVNNAGTVLRKPAAGHPDAYWDEVVAVSQTAPFILTRGTGREMVARRAGKIIFTASLLTFQGGINVPGYAAGKGAVGSLVKAFANEWAGR